MRAPITHTNLVAFDRPRFEAGCGGIDLYGGSFSFINSQQLVQIFRAVAANAVGLAFKAAIKAISPSLDSLITEFQTLLQNMNNLGKNSCQLAHLVVDSADKALGNAVNGDGAVGVVQNNMFTDAMGSLQGYLHDANDYFKKQAAVSPKAGNANMKLIMASGSSAILGIAGIGNVDGSADDASDPNSLNNRVLLSLMGYEVNAAICSNQNAAGTPDTTSAAAGTLPNLTCSGPATLKLIDLINGGGVGSTQPARPLQLYRCIDPNGTVVAGGMDPQICTKMELADFDFPGIRASINMAMFGSVDPSTAVDPDSILGRYNNHAGSSVQLTASQWQLIHQSGIPLITLFGKTANPDTRIAIAQRLDEHIIACVAAGAGEALYKASNGVQTGGENTLSVDAKANIEILRRDFMAQRETCLNDLKILGVVQALNESARLTGRNVK